jgi:cytosine/adenosine deaminase-related metal-dependent hydrolase
MNITVTRARTVIPLTPETSARGWGALSAPFEAIDDGVIIARNNHILSVEPYAAYRRRPDALPRASVDDLGDVLLTPGLVNCHTHLELSWMRGRTDAGGGFLPWLKSLVSLDRRGDGGAALPGLEDAVKSMRETGTSLAGDITSRIPETVLQTGESRNLAIRPFLEIIGHSPATPDALMAKAETSGAFSLAGHAFYTTPGEAFVKSKAWCDRNALPFSMHLSEHEDETECLFGHGEFHDNLRAASMIPESWNAPGMRPVAYADSLGLLRKGTLAVHCVTCNAGEVATLALSGAAVCLCPRSNEYIGVGQAPAKAFAEKGALLVLGTDSLASNHDLSLWNEAEYFLEKNIFPANALLRMATVNGASVLDFSRHFGRLERGMRFCYTIFPNGTFITKRHPYGL